MLNLTDELLFPDGEEEEPDILFSDNFDLNYSQIKLERYENRD